MNYNQLMEFAETLIRGYRRIAPHAGAAQALRTGSIHLWDPLQDRYWIILRAVQ